MADLYSNRFIFGPTGANQVQPRQLQIASTPVVATMVVSAALTVGQFIHMMTLPAGVLVTGVALDCDGLDTGTGLTLSVGDKSSGAYVASYITPIAAGQSSAGTVQGANVPGYLSNSQYLVNTDILVKVVTPATTAILGGAIRLAVHYTSDP